MFERDFIGGAAGFDTGTVAVMLGMLQSIHTEADGDVVMGEFAGTIAHAMTQLRELQQIAYQTMIEIEAERARSRPSGRLRLVRKTLS